MIQPFHGNIEFPNVVEMRVLNITTRRIGLDYVKLEIRIGKDTNIVTLTTLDKFLGHVKLDLIGDYRTLP
jgi:hypothetical protein